MATSLVQSTRMQPGLPPGTINHSQKQKTTKKPKHQTKKNQNNTQQNNVMTLHTV